MSPSALLYGVGLPLVAAIVFVADRRGCFAIDRFRGPIGRATALSLLGVALSVVTLVPARAVWAPPRVEALAFGRLFDGHLFLLLMLALWWLLSSRPGLYDFLGLRSDRPIAQAGFGVLLGLAGWVTTVVVGVVLGLVLWGLGASPPQTLPPVILQVARLSVEKKVLILGSAMTVEELFFRAFLQRRLGAVPATLLFLLAHLGYGEPLVLVGLAVISSVLAFAYARTKSLWAPILAHGTFDAIQLFVILPWVVRMKGL